MSINTHKLFNIFDRS